MKRGECPMFKIAYGAGHRLVTSGKRLPKALDPNETREWVLNDRVARYFAEAASQYEGVELLRVDDPEGKKAIDLKARCEAANDWGADFCLAIHHNAGIKLGKGGGIVAYIYKKGTKAEEYQKAIYNACIAAGGLKGNRAVPLATGNLYAVRCTDAPAVLMEYGFMDSSTDAPVILTEAYSKLVGYATMEGIAKVAGLKKKKKTSTSSVLYRVQIGAYSKKSNADVQLTKVKAAGFTAFIIKVGDLYKIQTGAFSKKANADAQLAKVKAAGFDAFITTTGGQATPEKTEVTFKVGDKVKMSSDATVYGKTTKFAPWVYKSTLYVREIAGDRIVISTLKTGAVTGAVDKKYLTHN